MMCDIACGPATFTRSIMCALGLLASWSMFYFVPFTYLLLTCWLLISVYIETSNIYNAFFIKKNLECTANRTHKHACGYSISVCCALSRSHELSREESKISSRRCCSAEKKGLWSSVCMTMHHLLHHVWLPEAMWLYSVLIGSTLQCGPLWAAALTVRRHASL
jgi:hypothetical protein